MTNGTMLLEQKSEMRLTKQAMDELIRCDEFPCVTMILPTIIRGREVRQNHVRFRNLINDAERRLSHSGWSHSELAVFFQEARALADDKMFWQHQDHSLAVYLNKDMFKVFKLPITLRKLAVVGQRFHVRDLIPLLTESGRYMVLTLSKDSSKLYVANRTDIEEMTLYDAPDSDSEGDGEGPSLQFHTGTKGGGLRPAMYHGHADEANDVAAEVAWCRAVDDALHAALDDTSVPLVVAAAEPMMSAFLNESDYDALVAKGIECSPNGLSAEDLREQAWELARPWFIKEREKAKRRLSRARSESKFSNDLDTIAKAATEGRVDTLFLSRKPREWGVFDAEECELELHDTRHDLDEDLLNVAAIEVMRTGGKVYTMRRIDIPREAKAAAIFRF